jgi:parallel beta-helix repeat protein
MPPSRYRVYIRISQETLLLGEQASLGQGWGVKAMRWRGVRFVCIAVLVIVVLMSACGQSKGAANKPQPRITVQPAGANDYSTLSAALASVSDGGTVVLGKGTFDLGDKTLKIAGKTLSIVGAGKRQTTIVSSAPTVLSFTGKGELSAENLSFRHVGSSAGPVVLVKDAKIDIHGCHMEGSRHTSTWYFAALYLKGKTTGMVYDCDFSNTSSGVDVGGSSRISLENNVFRGCDFSGIAFFNRASGEARDNTCTGCEVGIVLQDGAHALVESNRCSDNEYGIEAWGHSGGKIQENRCSGNHTAGIGVADSASPMITSNTCTHNEDGIDAVGGKGFGIGGNTCNANKAVGIGCWGYAKGIVSGNICNSNGHRLEGGICMGGHANVTVSGNSCERNANYGILFRDSARGQCVGNYCSEQSYGIDVDRHAYPTLSHNTCEYNSTANVWNWR